MSSKRTPKAARNDAARRRECLVAMTEDLRRVKKPSLQLSLDVAKLLHDDIPDNARVFGVDPETGTPLYETTGRSIDFLNQTHPHYTGSTDAAESALPRGAGLAIERTPDGKAGAVLMRDLLAQPELPQDKFANMAMAICAAILRDMTPLPD